MRIINIRKAQPIGDQLIDDLQINIDGHIEASTRTQLEELRREFVQDANVLGRALTESLPGGTIDQLLIFLLQEKASHFVVSHKS